MEAPEAVKISSNEGLCNEKFNSEREAPASIQEKKHVEMLKHLAELNNVRLQQSQSRKTQNPSAPPFESVDVFLNCFSEAKQKIDKALDGFVGNGDSQDKTLVKSGLESLSAQINGLEKLVAEDSYFLPSYEVRAAHSAIAELKERLENANSQLLPKKKFAFRNKVSRPNPNPKKPEENPDPKNIEENPDPIEIRKGSEKNNSSSFAVDAPGIRNKKGLIMVKNLDATKNGDFALSDLVNCKIYLRGRLRALFIYRLKDCQVFAGPVMGSVLIEEGENCVFMLASHQIRIHQTRNTDFYLRVRSRPIVEYTSNVRFAPYALFYRGIEQELQDSDLKNETGMWANVDDFRWLRSVSSPNWSVLPEGERLPLVDISNFKEEEETLL
uniref:C-CAP/cofactor C-like domain-containing protein n=1 Tax=Araucaria cunninghamii TaxID=56994 RepID=A0A0D6QRL8_ARACU